MRLATLVDAADAFETTYESALERTLESWTKQANITASGSHRNTMLGFHQNVPVGLAALYQDPNRADIAHLIQVWVHLNYRGTELAPTLISQLFS
ncbi:MAG: GNAT family N-acetyltransferase [Cyanobacteria bacterium J06638_22]